MSSIARKASAFKLGKKPVFLSNALVALIHRPNQDPHFATFKVPLTFTKFDLRDYLLNLYNVEVKSVRSLVTPSPVINALTDNANSRARIHRGAPNKYMTVELVEPFAWPELPRDLEPWNKKLWDARSEYAEEVNKQAVAQSKMETLAPSKKPVSVNDRGLREKAEKLLKGEVTWSNGSVLDEIWEEKGAKGAEKSEPVKAEMKETSP